MGKGNKTEKSLDSVLEDFDVYFHECFGSKLPVAFIQDSGWKPLTDVYETDDEFVVRIEVGGITEEDVNAGWEGNSLVISGRRKEQEQSSTRFYHKIEITTGPFERRVTVPSHVTLDRESFRIVYKGGILEIRAKKIPASGT
jgi:HSP20 family protein